MKLISFLYLVRTKLTNFIVKDVVSSVEALIDLCLAMVTYDQGRYDKSIQLFDKVFEDNFHIEKKKRFYLNRFEISLINFMIVHFSVNLMHI
jgi:hypothetical protein